MKVGLSLIFAACLAILPAVAFAETNEVAPGVLHLGVIENPDIQESSGIIPVRGARGIFWTHNDSGLDIIYAITADGRSLGQWKIKDVDLQNFEDIATGPGRVYVADVGNNTGSRDRVNVYAVPARPPRLSGEVHPLRAWELKYPGDPFDCESFFVLRGFGHLISKDLRDGTAPVYRFPLNRSGASFELQKTCKLNVSDQPRGADNTPDGRRLAVITGTGAYLFSLPRGLPTNGVIEPTLFVEFHHDSMEGCCFTQNGLLVTSESRDLFLFTDPAFCYPARKVAPAKR